MASIIILVNRCWNEHLIKRTLSYGSWSRTESDKSDTDTMKMAHWIYAICGCWSVTSVRFLLALASSTSSPRTVLVTGGCGYIGSHTCLELLSYEQEEYRVVVVDNLDNSKEESLKRVRKLVNVDGASSRLVFRHCDMKANSQGQVQLH